MNYIQAKTKLEAYHQEHLLDWYDEISETEQSQLLEQIDALDMQLLDIFANYQQNGEAPRGKLEPMGALTIQEIAENHDKFEHAGLDAIRHGKVGAVLLAGGMGTRLGFDKPKGMYNIGLSRKLYIFECLINNLMQVVDKAGAFVPLFIMTSEKNDEETREFFAEMKYIPSSSGQRIRE
ncbi:MAG: UTP--glucose-1-phosphate uridylyltransferase, partial [Oscillospiraceae bacterium]|nr:UTP--glucose-1-phosphate uridylyltransferase [Oscillospiraceae bacterium]